MPLPRFGIRSARPTSTGPVVCGDQPLAAAHSDLRTRPAGGRDRLFALRVDVEVELRDPTRAHERRDGWSSRGVQSKRPVFAGQKPANARPPEGVRMQTTDLVRRMPNRQPVPRHPLKGPARYRGSPDDLRRVAGSGKQPQRRKHYAEADPVPADKTVRNARSASKPRVPGLLGRWRAESPHGSSQRGITPAPRSTHMPRSDPRDDAPIPYRPG